MSKIVIEFDTNTSKAVLKIGKTKVFLMSLFNTINQPIIVF